MKKPTGCRFKKKCPLWDASSSGQEWCVGSPIDDDWERCPKPKLRKKRMKRK